MDFLFGISAGTGLGSGIGIGSWELRDPLFLLLALLAPVVYRLASRLPSVLTYSSLDLVAGAPESLRSRAVALPPLMLALSVVCLAVALAGPRTGDASSRLHREGIAITMVVDRSGSMWATS